jgi:hypothetical protein
MEGEVKAARDEVFQYLQNIKSTLEKKSTKRFTGLTVEHRQALNISHAIMIVELLEGGSLWRLALTRRARNIFTRCFTR